MTDWQRRSEGGLAVGVVAFVVATLFAVLAWGGGLNASFTGSRFDCPDDPSVVACWKSDVTGANALVDRAENLLIDRVEFDDWTESGTCAVTADQWRNPVDGTVDADYLDNTGGANTDYRENDTGETADVFHTGSVWVRSDYVHTVTIQLYEDGVGEVDHFDFVAGNNWRRISVDGVSNTGGDLMFRTFPGEMGVSIGTAYFYGAQLVENTPYITNMGIFINPADQAVAKPVHDLAQTNNPTGTRAHAQIQGNKGPAREYDGVNQLYSKAHDVSVNVFDGDMTLTMFLGRDSDDAGEAVAFCHGSTDNDGFYLQASVPLGQWIAQFAQNGDTTGPTVTVATADGRYHVVQVVREDDTATITVDGVESAGVDVTGYGIDANRTLYVGAIDGPALWWDGQISYTVLRSRALPDDELAEEREMLWGIYTNWSSVNQWSFDRSTTAYKTFSNQYENTYPSHSMDLVAVDHPRVAGQGGGLLVEGDVTQLHGLTEEFQTWALEGVCAVTANNYVAPNGTLTADLLDNTGGISNDYRYIMTANLGDLTGRVFTGTVFVRTDMPHTVTLRLFETNIGNIAHTDFYATNEWQRIVVTGTAAGGGPGMLFVLTYPGESGVATGVAHFWGGNITETTFATSYVPNAGVATSQVTKTADDMSISVLEAGTNNRILADEYCQNCAADRITLYGEWRAEWSSNADIGADRRLVNMGNAGSANNDLELYVSSAGNVFLRFQDDAATVYTINSAANPVDFSSWFDVRAVVDFSDLSRSELYINGVVSHAADSGNWTAGGGATYDTNGNNIRIRIGATRTGAVDGFHWTRNLRENNQEIRP